MPPATPAGLLVAQVFCEQGTEFDIPLAQRLMEEWRSHAVKRGQPRCSDQDARRFFPRRASVGRHRRSYTPDTVGEFMLGKKAHHDL